MNDQELLNLIERDREAPLPEGPDPRWIATRLRMAAGEPRRRTENPSELHLLVGLLILGSLTMSALALYAGRPELLLLWPTFLLLSTPLLLWKGANR